MKKITLLLALLLSFASHAANEYVPTVKSSTLPSPEQALGFAVGEWHVRHDQIQRYFEQLAAASPRAQLEVIGYSHEQRPLLQLVISSERNLAQLEQIRQLAQQGDQRRDGVRSLLEDADGRLEGDRDDERHGNRLAECAA